VKNGNGRTILWAVGIAVAAAISIALAALHASTATQVRIDMNCKDIEYMRAEQDETKKDMRWIRNALRSIADQVGATVPPEE